MQRSTGIASTSVQRLTYQRSKAMGYFQRVYDPSRYFSGSRATLNANGSSGNSGSGKLVADKINIDPKTKLRMDIRKEAMNNSGTRSGNNANNSGNKWAPAENWDPNTPGRYRQAYEETQNRSGYRPYNNNPGNSRRQGQDAKRPGRYYDERSGQNAGQNRGGQPNQQPRQNAPSSFATSSAFGFSAPTPATKPAAPSSFATSPGFGFSSPTKAVKEAKATPVSTAPAKQNAQPNTPVQKIKAETPKQSAPPSTSSPSSTSGTATGSTTSSGTTAAPTPTASLSPTPTTSSPSQAPLTSSQAPTPSTFTKSTRSAKENAKRHVEQRSKQRKQRQKPAKDVFIPEAINVSNLAGLLGARMPHFERTMKAMGMEITRHDHSKYPAKRASRTSRSQRQCVSNPWMYLSYSLDIGGGFSPGIGVQRQPYRGQHPDLV